MSVDVGPSCKLCCIAPWKLIWPQFHFWKIWLRYMRFDLNADTQKRSPCKPSKTRSYILHMSYEDNRRFSGLTPHTSHSDMVQCKESWEGCSGNFQSQFRTSSLVEYYRTTLFHRGRSEAGLGTFSVVRQSRTRSKGNLVWDIALHR